MTEKFRLVTRADFDGLVCASLLRHIELVNEIFRAPQRYAKWELRYYGARHRHQSALRPFGTSRIRPSHK
jgi:hypothetical protein